MSTGSETVLEREIGAFNKLKDELIAHHNGKWVLIKDETLVGAFDTLDNAAQEAIRRFGRGPYLIRQVGGPDSMTLPASVMYRPTHADN